MKSLPVVLALGLAACGGEKKSSPSTGSGSGAAGSAAPVAAGVAIFVDDVQVGTLADAQVALWPRLDTLVPVSARRLGTWDKVILKGASPSPVTLEKPSSAYPELVPAVFPGEGGKAAFGMFDPVELAKKGQPSLRENAVSEIRLVLAKGSGRGENDHHGGDGGGSDPAQLAVTIKTKDGEKILKGPQLLEIPREAPPGDTDGKGWKLSAILASQGVTKYERLLLSDAKGTNLTLEKQDVDAQVAIPFVKLNRQGSLRFRVYRKQGDTWQPNSDLRGLARIEVLK